MTTNSTNKALNADVLLDALGGLIGFMPERSLVLVAFDDDGSINSTMRHDLLLDAGGVVRPEFIGVVDNLATICRQYDAAAVVAVIVDDRYPPDSPEIASIIAQIAVPFAPTGGFAAAYATREYAVGSKWHTVFAGPPTRFLAPPPGAGSLADPTTSPTALDRAVRRGRPVLRRRAEMSQELVEKSHCDDPNCSADALTQMSRATREEQADLLAFAHDAVSVLASGTRSTAVQMPCAAMATWHRVVTDVRVRDALLVLAISDLREPAERIWRELTQVLRGRGRASAATLLAHLHYIAGEGALAGIALDIALGADRDWSFAILLDRALRAGLRPALLWELIGDSYRIAEELGVDMPRPTLPIAG
ncbi:hypothetical protein GOEFS_042_00280 [Gordonia effusa NBRC 100432]|uniref:DUF4192 domain-containing protein n=1 Tax=Gordonia effusa NBRC 100432 TaxID=1077974 RepID=H0QYN6_9ACTN|nr:DUF4192 domain-containing protein [Gordonia effusa]GAB17937.1 hypothetical protein GOEFS_042_00280 [Gordonia effusa NBRC 100432]